MNEGANTQLPAVEACLVALDQYAARADLPALEALREACLAFEQAAQQHDYTGESTLLARRLRWSVDTYLQPECPATNNAGAALTEALNHFAAHLEGSAEAPGLERVWAPLDALEQLDASLFPARDPRQPSESSDLCAWLARCWAPEIHDPAGLAAFRASCPATPTKLAWRAVEQRSVALDEIPELAREHTLSHHRATVMDICLTRSGLAASTDFSGAWSRWTQDSLQLEARGSLGPEARAIHLSEDGRRVAALVNFGPSALYLYDVVVVDTELDTTQRLAGPPAEWLAWTPDGEYLLVGNALGYRIHHASGTPLCTEASPKGLGSGRFVHARGELRCIRRGVLGGVELGTLRPLPCVDLRPSLRGHQAHWRPESFDIDAAAGLAALAPGGNHIFVLELDSARTLVDLEFTGVHVVGAKLRFDASGRYLVISLTHIRGDRVTHLVYDGVAGELLGRLPTGEATFNHHARAAMSAEHGRLYAADGSDIQVARVPS